MLHATIRLYDVTSNEAQRHLYHLAEYLRHFTFCIQQSRLQGEKNKKKKKKKKRRRRRRRKKKKKMMMMKRVICPPGTYDALERFLKVRAFYTDV
jgi:CRISPR/Cas system-associated endoribonuclease Cas2